PRSSVPSQQRLAVVDASEFHEELSYPFPATLPTTRTHADVPVECSAPVHSTLEPPPSWPATAQRVWSGGIVPRPLPPWETSTAGTTLRTAAFARQAARARTPAPPPWQRSSSRRHWY